MKASRAHVALAVALGAICAGWLLGRFGPPGFPPVVLASYAFPIVVLAPAAAIVLAAALMRARRLAAAGAVVFVALVYGEGARISLRSPPAALAAAPSADRVRVMTYNIAKWEWGATAIARAVASADADVVCLEEAGAYPWVTGPDQSLDALARALPGFRFVGDAEVRIGSRLPLRDSREVSLPAGPTTRPLVLAVADVGGHAVTVAAVHLMPTLLFQAPPPGSERPPLRTIAEGRLQQAERVLAALEDVRGPVVLCGDFNAPPTAAPVRRIAARLHDAWTERGTGFGLTDPARFPYGRIDYVFVRGLRVDDVAVGCGACDASDHRPVVAGLSSLGGEAL